MFKNLLTVLIDLRFLEYGESGGIENVTYYLIDSLKSLNINLILDVQKTSSNKIQQKYIDYPNIKLISDPVQGRVLILKSKSKLIRKVINFSDRILYNLFKLEILHFRKKWANSIEADVVIYTNHLMEVQHRKIPVISFIHAILPNYSKKEFEFINSHILNATALVSLWRYPFHEFIEKYPARKDTWHWIPCMLNVNLNKHHKLSHSNSDPNWLYVSFFTERKNHIALVIAYDIALKNDNNIPNLIFVGKGDVKYYNKVKQLVNKLNLNHKISINFEFKSHSEIANLYENTTAVISPSLWEAASGTIVEACLAGIPAACSNVPPLTDFADCFGLKMIFFDPTDVNDMANKLIELHLKNSELKKWGIENSNKLKKYDSQFFGNEIFKLIDSVVKTKTNFQS